MAKKPGFEDWLRAVIAVFGSGASAAGGVGAMTLLSGVGGGTGATASESMDKVDSLGHNFNYDLTSMPLGRHLQSILLHCVAMSAQA